MKRLITTAFALLAIAAVGAPTVQAAEFEKYALESVSASLSTTQAGAHPDFLTTFRLTTQTGGEPYALTRDIQVKLPPGLFGNPQAFPTCTNLQLGTAPPTSECPPDSQVGVTEITLSGANTGTFVEPIYNMPAPGGDVAARFGFFAGPYPASLNVRVDPSDESLVATVESAPAAAALVAASTTFWGVPAAPSHDFERMTPAEAATGTAPPIRHSSLPETPFMTNPNSCVPGQQVGFTVTNYALPGAPSSMTAPFPQITGCGFVGFHPEATVKPTTEQATTGTGLDVVLQAPTKGLEFPNLLYDSEVKRVEVTLPEGMTINPSEAEGLGVCTEADLANETYNSPPNQGCPETSKIGSVTASSPVIDRVAEGSLYLAQPYQNPFNSLLALYLVVKIPDRGVLVKLAGRVTPDPLTGQLKTVFDGVPQLPVASFDLHFREGARAPLVTPPACGRYTTLADIEPWALPGTTLLRESAFSITSGVAHATCPVGGLTAFHPNLVAGSLNNAAGAFSPFNVRITRTDAEQEITHFSIKLPPGVVGKLAGIPYCSDAAISAAKARTGAHGAEEELATPTCPGATEIGTSLAGAGVGDVLTYVPGKVYLAGPYHGAPISIVDITTAKAGPFDLGTVVVREALKVNPETAQVSVDAAGSDPIPHIIQGIPVHLRDIRVYVDRPGFVLNPTDCKATSTASTVLGSGTNFASEADDRPITVTSRFQSADCASLGFKPQVKLTLSGPTKRAGLPRLKAVVTPRPGDANIGRAVVTLPKSEFLEQGHIGTVCTRVQFNAGGGNGEQCPAKSIYGHARAATPLLDEPLEGPVYLRSNGGERRLPDLVAALHSTDIDIDLLGYIDSLHPKGSDVSRIRTTFATVPDAPVSKFTLQMFGGKKGLLVNSANLCKGTHRAISKFVGQNGRRSESEPVVKARCGKKKHKKHAKHKKTKAGKKKGSARLAVVLRHGVAW